MQAQHVERLGVADVVGHQALGEALLLLASAGSTTAPRRCPTTSRRASRLAIFSAASRPLVDQLAAHDLDLPQRCRARPARAVDRRSSRTRRRRTGSSNASRLAVRVGEVLVRRDQLVLGAADDVREAPGGVRVARHGVVQEVRELRPQLAQQQPLADLVEHVRACRRGRARPDGPTGRGCRTSGSCGPTAGWRSRGRAACSRRSISSAAARTL